MVTKEELQAQIQQVARARAASTLAIDERAMARSKWESEHQDLELAVSETYKAKEAEEAKLRELTLIAFNETGKKKPAPEVGIREIDKLTYESAAALFWATEHKLALKLDTPAFEKIVKASPANFPFVDIDTVATATIATNIEVK